MKQHFNIFSLLILFLLFPINLLKADIKELESKLETTKGVPKIEILNSLSEEYFTRDMNKSLYFANLAISETSNLSNDYLKLVAYFNHANANYYLGNFKESQISIKECLQLTNKLKDFEFEIEILNLKGILLRTINDYEQSYKVYNQALTLANKINSKESISKLLNNLGNVFESMGDYETAVNYYLQSLNIKLNDSNKIRLDSSLFSYCYLNIGKNYLLLENNKQALEFFKIALSYCNSNMLNEKGIINYCIGQVYFKDNNNIKAIEYFSNSLKSRTSILDQRIVADIINNVGEVHRRNNNFVNALECYKESQEIYNKYQYMYGATNVNLNYAMLYIQKSDLFKANSYLEQASKLIEKNKFKTLQLELYEKYAEYYFKKGDLKKTLEYKDKYIKLKDTISFVDRNRKLNSLVAKFTMEGKDKQIEGYEAEKRIMDLENSQKKILIGMLVLVILIVIGGLLFVFNRMKLIKKHDKEVVLKNEDLEKSYAREKELTAMNKTILEIISHDFKSPITAIQMYTNLINDSINKGNLDKVIKSSFVINRAAMNLDRVINQLKEISDNNETTLNKNPQKINYNSLIEEIVTYDFMQHTTVKHNFKLNFPELPIIGFINTTVADHIFHNLISNAVKYSPENTDIIINLSNENGILHFSIQDFGRGIPVAEQDKLFSKYHRFSNTNGVSGTGIGLFLVKKVITELQGTIAIVSAENSGTKVDISFPVDTRI